MAINRTPELLTALASSRRGGYGKTALVLDDENSYVENMATTSGRRIYGPAYVEAEQWPDGGINLIVKVHFRP